MPNIILEIVGTGFNLDFEDNLVTFNLGAVGIVTAATTTKLTVQLTTHPTTTGSLTAVVASPLSSGSPVQVAIVALGVVGTVDAANRSIVSTSTLTIAGTGFDTTAANNTVTFNLNAVGTVTSATATELVVTFSTFPTTGNLNAVVTVDDYLPSLEFQVATILPAFALPEFGSITYDGFTHYFEFEDTITDEDIWGANPTHYYAYSNTDYEDNPRDLSVIVTDEFEVVIVVNQKFWHSYNLDFSFSINTITPNNVDEYFNISFNDVEYTVEITWGSAL